MAISENRQRDADTLYEAAIVLEKWTVKENFWIKLICRLLRSSAKSVEQKTTKFDKFDKLAQQAYKRDIK